MDQREIAEFQHPETPMPLLAQIGVTYRCNLTCEHCYALDLRERNEFSLAELENLGRELVAAGSVALTYSHGESLIRRDFHQIAELFHGLGFHQTLMNNGFYIRTARDAARLARTGIAKALVSLDHSDEAVHNEHRGHRNAYITALRAVDLLRDAGVPRVGFSMALDEYNYGAIEDVLALAVRHGLTDVSLMQTRYMSGHTLSGPYLTTYRAVAARIYEAMISHRGVLDVYTHDPFMLTLIDERLRADRRAYESFVGANVCNVGTNMVSIDPVGNVTGCNFLRRGFGNVRDEPFGQIWARLVDFYAPVKQPSTGPCTSCSVAATCSSGCLAFHEAGVFDARCAKVPFPQVGTRPWPEQAGPPPSRNEPVMLTLQRRRPQ